MRQILEKCYEYNIELYFLYIDFTRVFDTVNRQKVIQKLQEIGSPNKLIRLIKIIQHTKASVIVENLKTDLFDISTGYAKGIHCLTLFNLISDSVIKKLDLRGDKVLR
jgi:hypothetical protein